MTLILPVPADWLPRCAVCGVPIERVSRWIDRLRSSVMFRFECHGEAQEAELFSEEIWGMDITMGEAFADARKALP